MCAITASFDPVKLKELYKLNAYRGELSWSLCSFSIYKKNRAELNTLFQDNGVMPGDILNIATAMAEHKFFVAHSQAPTTQAGHMHPAVYGDTLLWHNGIIKQKALEHNTWDTLWLLEQITSYGWSSLSRIDGSFACIMYNGGEMFVFRNELSPLFYDIDFNFSSTKFKDSPESVELPPNRVFKLDLEHKQLTVVAYFETHTNPYYIPEET
jgi:hypothetical protein